MNFIFMKKGDRVNILSPFLYGKDSHVTVCADAEGGSPEGEAA